MHHRAIAILLLLAAAIIPHEIFAGTGTRITLPAPRVKVRSGLRLTVDSHWVIGSGYRPITIRVAPILGGPAPAERFIDVLVRPRGWHGGEKAGAVTATVHLPQGAMYGEARVFVPQTNAWNAMDVEPTEDGKRLKDLEVKRMALGTRYFYETSDGTPSILFLHRMANDRSTMTQTPAALAFSMVVGPTPAPCAGGLSIQPLLILKTTPVSQIGMGKQLNLLPDIRVLAGRFPMSYYNGYVTADRFFAKTPVSDSETLRLVADLPFLGMCSHESLPDHWLGLSGIDILFASFDELRQLSVEQPVKWEAVRTWLSTGTLLCVYGVGTEYDKLSDLEKLLEMQAPPSRDEPMDGWEKPKQSEYQEEIKVLKDDVGGANYWRQQADILRKSEKDSKSKSLDPVAPTKLPFVHRAIGQGHVVALAAENPFPGDESEWSWLFNSVPSRKWLWYQRHGVSNQRQNRQFWNFLIADIGRAPVISFISLITLFAVVIGPVNYYFLHQRGRLYLLLVTVPFGALVVTFSLFLYAALADGLGTRVQVRSFTDIDQRLGRAVSWSRHMYYAGLAPSRGLVFPADAAVYPIDYEPVNGMGMADTSRHLVWGEDQQNLVSGYFISRTPSQMLVVEPRRTTAGLVIDEKSETGKGPRITNRLGTSIERLVVCDAVGDLWSGEQLGDGQSMALQKSTKEVEDKYWSRLKNANRLKYPEGFNPTNLENVSGIFGSGFRMGGSAAPPTVDTSILETGLIYAQDVDSMQPQSYVALVKRPPSVSLGVDSADERAGFHLVEGRW
jgi:hypothetical protein